MVQQSSEDAAHSSRAPQVFASVAGQLAGEWGTGTDRSGSFCEALLLPQVGWAWHSSADGSSDCCQCYALFGEPLPPLQFYLGS